MGLGITQAIGLSSFVRILIMIVWILGIVFDLRDLRLLKDIFNGTIAFMCRVKLQNPGVCSLVFELP